jgi:predicted HicB family RNase H-like nuclease
MPNNLISYEGNTATELHADFKEAINTYPEHCQRKGIKPRKAYNGVLNIRIPSDIHCRIAVIAENTETSINAFICDSIERRLEHGH